MKTKLAPNSEEEKVTAENDSKKQRQLEIYELRQKLKPTKDSPEAEYYRARLTEENGSTIAGNKKISSIIPVRLFIILNIEEFLSDCSSSGKNSKIGTGNQIIPQVVGFLRNMMSLEAVYLCLITQDKEVPRNIDVINSEFPISKIVAAVFKPEERNNIHIYSKDTELSSFNLSIDFSVGSDAIFVGTNKLHYSISFSLRKEHPWVNITEYYKELATEYDFTEITEKVLSLYNDDDFTPLMALAAGEKAELINKLFSPTKDSLYSAFTLTIDAKAQLQELLQEKDKLGLTALHYAAFAGQDPKTPALLIKNGADINSLTKYNYSPIMLSIYNENPLILESFLQPELKANIELRNSYYGNTVLGIAAIRENTVAVKQIMIFHNPAIQNEIKYVLTQPSDIPLIRKFMAINALSSEMSELLMYMDERLQAKDSSLLFSYIKKFFRISSKYEKQCLVSFFKFFLETQCLKIFGPQILHQTSLRYIKMDISRKIKVSEYGITALEYALSFLLGYYVFPYEKQGIKEIVTSLIKVGAYPEKEFNQARLNPKLIEHCTKETLELNLEQDNYDRNYSAIELKLIYIVKLGISLEEIAKLILIAKKQEISMQQEETLDNSRSSSSCRSSSSLSNSSGSPFSPNNSPINSVPSLANHPNRIFSLSSPSTTRQQSPKDLILEILQILVSDSPTGSENNNKIERVSVISSWVKQNNCSYIHAKKSIILGYIREICALECASLESNDYNNVIKFTALLEQKNYHLLGKPELNIHFSPVHLDKLDFLFKLLKEEPQPNINQDMEHLLESYDDKHMDKVTGSKLFF